MKTNKKKRDYLKICWSGLSEFWKNTLRFIQSKNIEFYLFKNKNDLWVFQIVVQCNLSSSGNCIIGIDRLMKHDIIRKYYCCTQYVVEHDNYHVIVVAECSRVQHPYPTISMLFHREYWSTFSHTHDETYHMMLCKILW